jgi:hypothetical protein
MEDTCQKARAFWSHRVGPKSKNDRGSPAKKGASKLSETRALEEGTVGSWSQACIKILQYSYRRPARPPPDFSTALVTCPPSPPAFAAFRFRHKFTPRASTPCPAYCSQSPYKRKRPFRITCAGTPALPSHQLVKSTGVSLHDNTPSSPRHYRRLLHSLLLHQQTAFRRAKRCHSTNIIY